MNSGLTQPQLAAMVGCGQSTISGLLNGKIADPRTSTGLALITLARMRSGFELAGANGAPAVPAEEVRDAA